MTTLLEFFQQRSFVWKLTPMLLIPFLVIVLGEISERLERQQNPLAQSVRTIRHVALPILAVVLLMRYIFGITGAQTSLRMVETAFWVSVMVAGLMLLSNLFRLAEVRPASLWAGIPRFFFAVGRTGVVLVVAAYVLSTIWQVDLGKLASTVGLGSFVIALALQDTLSNLFSGFLLLADRPFKIGDWLRYQDQWVQVIDINWRAVRVRGRDHTVTSIPNGLLSKQLIQNAGAEDSPYRMVLSISFYSADPTNVVKQVLQDILMTTEGVLRDPAPVVHTTGYGPFEISYAMRFTIRFRDYLPMPDRIFSRIFYAAKRHKLTPYPVKLRHYLDYNQVPPDEVPEHIQEALQAAPLFNALEAATINELAQVAMIHHFGAGERVTHQGAPDASLFSIQRGRVIVSALDHEGEEHEITRLGPGDFFGEMTVLRTGPSPVSVTTIDDLQVLIIDHETIVQLFHRNPGFAMMLNDFVEKRRKAIEEVTGTETAIHGMMARSRWIDRLRGDHDEVFQEGQED